MTEITVADWQWFFTEGGHPDNENIQRCIRCALCLAVCPTYQQSYLETESPRGRVALIKAASSGSLKVSPNLVRLLYVCLDCRACQTTCPSGVKIGEWVIAARAEIEAHRRRWVVPQFLRDTIYRRLFPYPERLEMAASALRIYQRVGLQKVLRGSRVLKPFPAVEAMERLLPPLLARPLRQELPEVAAAWGQERLRVGFFLGCFMSLFFPEASASTVRVLRENGCTVVTPRGQKCCGAPHRADGEMEVARDLARHNVRVFEQAQVDYVVTDCAACGTELKAWPELLADDPEYAPRARALKAKARDITEFLVGLPLRPPQGEVRARVTYHDPCHLAHAQGIAQPPRHLLKSIPGLEYVELAEANWCCGSAGTYSITHRRYSQGILDRKMSNIVATGARVVATANPGCLLQLRLGAQRTQRPLALAHVVELLDRAYRAEGN